MVSNIRCDPLREASFIAMNVVYGMQCAWVTEDGFKIVINRLKVLQGHLFPYLFMPPTLKKWGTYWFRLVRVCVCVSVCLCLCVYVCVCVYGASRYRLETSCMDSSWKNSQRIFLVFPELSPLVKLRPFDKQGDEIL